MFKSFFRNASLALAVLLGAAGVAQAVDTIYNYGVYGLPMSVDTTNPSFQFGTTATAPVHVGSAQLTAPALTSCGTSPAITGTDIAGLVTMGTGTPTGCVITFNVAYTAAPNCVVTWIATPLAAQSYVVSTAAITLTQTATSSNKVQYMCMAQAGG